MAIDRLQKASELRAKALRYRRMAYLIWDERTVAALRTLADEYDEMARRLESDDG